VALNILNYNPINLKQMPHVIHYILWFSGHSNCFRPNYEEKWLPFLGLTLWSQAFQTLRIIRKLRRLYSLTQPVHVKVTQLFNFVIFPAKKYITPALPGQNTHPAKQYVLFWLDQGLHNHTWMLKYVQSARVCQTNFCICHCAHNHWLYNNLVIAN